MACFKGDFNDAVKTFKKANHLERVVSLYTDLRRFAEAKEAMVAAAGDTADGLPGNQKAPESARSLLTKHAEWARTTKDHRAAASMYIQAGDYAAATELAAEHGWVDV